MEALAFRDDLSHPSLEIALDAMPVGVSWANLADGKILFMNRKFSEIFGYSIADFVDIAAWIESYPFKEDRALAGERWGRYFAAPDGSEMPIEPMELRIRCKDGSMKTILHSGVILPAAGLALATFVDISDRKRDELAIEKSARQARESQIFYRLLLDHCPGMMVLAPFDDGQRYVSAAVYQITGFTAEEYLAHDRYDMIHPEDRAAVSKLVLGLRGGTRTQILRYRTLRKDGGYCWVEAIVNSFVQPDSLTTSGYVASIRDISDQIQQEESLARENQRLATFAAVDDLTGIANRRAFNRALEGEAQRQARPSRDVSLLLLDIDLFKQFNDLYGHTAGDLCLRRVAQALEQTVRRDTDLAARFGGEEFVALMPMTDLAGAAGVARQMMAAVAALAIPHEASPCGVLTVSVGVACRKANSPDHPAHLLEAADRALYKAKEGGRNRLHVDAN